MWLKISLYFMLIFLSFFMIFISHPLSMTLMILIQTLLTCLITGMLINSYWFSYILFLIFLGGMLVLFIYITTIASNELFKLNLMKIMMMIFFISLVTTYIIFILNKFYWFNNFFNQEMMNFTSKYLFFNNENKLNLAKLYNNQTFIFMMLMIIYLFITLIAIVKITNIFFGPLRMFK